MSIVARKLCKGRAGQALVEFALVVPIFLLLVIGVIEFGRAWNLQQTITDAAREGARRAVVFDPTLTVTEVQTAVKAKIQAAGFDSTQATIVWQDCTAACTALGSFNDLARGDVLNVQVRMPYRFIFLKPLINLANTSSNGSLTLQTATQMRKE
jgi:Flp pilus assembly protein TadG